MATRTVQPTVSNAGGDASRSLIPALVAIVNQLQAQIARITGSNFITAPTLSIGSTPTAVATNAFAFRIGGVAYAKAAVAAGTAPGDDVIPQNKYGAVAFDIGADGTIDVIEAAANADPGYATAAAAIAGIAAVAAAHIRIGTVTAIKTDGAFTFGTTNLNAANSTVVYTPSTNVDAAPDTIAYAAGTTPS